MSCGVSALRSENRRPVKHENRNARSASRSEKLSLFECSMKPEYSFSSSSTSRNSRRLRTFLSVIFCMGLRRILRLRSSSLTNIRISSVFEWSLPIRRFRGKNEPKNFVYMMFFEKQSGCSEFPNNHIFCNLARLPFCPPVEL